MKSGFVYQGSGLLTKPNCLLVIAVVMSSVRFQEFISAVPRKKPLVFRGSFRGNPIEASGIL